VTILEKYQGIKINEEIILVEKLPSDSPYGNEDSISQAYVVQTDSPKMLETAKTWAAIYKYVKDADGNYIRTETGGYQHERVEGIVHRYKNGSFDFYIHDSANGSSQGGKLSFWTAKIVAPDGKEFLIGINSDLLLDMFKYNTFINGKCQSKVWLGRQGGQRVGAFTESMPAFSQSHKDAEFRKLRTTVKYSIGDIVKTKTNTFVYLGEQTEYFSKQNLYEPSENSRIPDLDVVGYTLMVDNKPFKYHAYLILDSINIDAIKNAEDLKRSYKDSLSNAYYSSIIKEPKKLNRILAGHIDDIDESFYWEINKIYYHHKAEAKSNAYKNAKKVYENSLNNKASFVKSDFNRMITNMGYWLESEIDFKIAGLYKDFFINYKNISTNDVLEFLNKHLAEFDSAAPEYADSIKLKKLSSVSLEDDYRKYLQTVYVQAHLWGRHSGIVILGLQSGREGAKLQ